ncbi:MAG: leucine-rich repeat domain-containing protein, partial [Candidatus Thorarchaeota archaeon]
MILVQLKFDTAEKLAMEETYPVDIVIIDLERQNIIQIDLIPLCICKHLMYLYLSYNSLTSLDLAPLAQCQKLRELKLYSNNIAEIDLSPLENCNHLEWLNLGFNNLKTLDLTPLTGCKSLRYLNVTGNNIQAVDASPIIDKRMEFWIDVQKPTVTLPFKTQLTDRIIRLDRVNDDELSWHNWNYTIIPITQRIASGNTSKAPRTRHSRRSSPLP